MFFPSILYCILTYIIALLAIAFYTLLERKILGYIQLRKGPNKISLIGIPQPLADALKLFTKELKTPTISNISIFIRAPILRLLLALLIWSLFPTFYPSNFFSFRILIFLCISALNVYSTLGAGWSSNSKYSLLGALRGIAQTISYEVRISLVLLGVLIFFSSYSFIRHISFNQIPILIIPLTFFLWFTTTLAETNRTPFDFAEGESELVSGFNTEYRRGSFAIIFIAEYARIIIIGGLTAILFFPIIYSVRNIITFPIKVFIVAFIYIWARGTLPRIRYDRLISLTWKCFLPFALGFLILTCPLYL